MQTWLDRLIQATRELESPERFFWWSGAAAISAILRRNVWLDKFAYLLYPNIYVIVVSARSGLRKGLPIGICSSFVESLQCTRVIAGQNSIQGVIKELSLQRTLENGTVLTTAQALLSAPEFNDFLLHDDSALTTLTNIYDTHAHPKEWTKRLRGSEPEVLKEPCLTLLGAANEVLFNDMVQMKDIEGGFVARTFIIHESRRRSINSLMYRPDSTLDKCQFVEELRPLINLKGAFLMGDKVRNYYNEWYHKIAKLEYDDKTGAIERIGDSVLKLAMIVSASRAPDLVIGLSDMETAIERTEEAFSGIKQVTIGSGKSEIAPQLGIVLKALLAAPGNKLERQAFLRKIWPNVDVMPFDRIMETLGETAGSGAVRIYRDEKHKIIYELKQDVVEQYKQFKGE